MKVRGRMALPGHQAFVLLALLAFSSPVLAVEAPAASPATQDQAVAPAAPEPTPTPPARIAPDQFHRLQDALERYRGIASRGGWGKVPTDLVMGPGFTYDCRRIAVLERRLIAEGYLARESDKPAEPEPRWNWGRSKPKPDPHAPLGQAGPCLYTPELAAAMRAFQADRNVIGFGQLGTQTMAQLNRPVGEIVAMLEQDVERWRERGINPRGTYLLVSIPFFELVAMEDDREALRMPVVVGQRAWETPLFSDELEYLIVNPDWSIPPKIAKLEYLPKARYDRNFYRWQGITESGGTLRQKPGPRNPLGRLKFVMPNRDNVYLHDTPEKGAFEALVRALSHGCVRLARPLDLADYLLREDGNDWDLGRVLREIASGRTTRISLKHHMPVHLVYSTTRVNEEGRVEIRPDVYGKNRVRGPREEDPAQDPHARSASEEDFRLAP